MVNPAVDERNRVDVGIRQIVECFPVAVVVADGGGEMLFLNSRAVRLFGFRPDELIGRPIETLLPKRFGRDCYAVDKDGRQFPVEIASNHVEADWGALVLYTVADTTRQKQSEQELIDANKSLLQANQRIAKLKEQLEQENVYLQEEIVVERNHFEVIGRSEPIRRVLMKAEQVAPTVSAVLLLGETGTGKELIARAIHRNSKRKDRLMVKVNCAALPASLVESELFGREKGAFTGALTREIGRFELAHDSTIFLDEIGELPLELQAKLLRVLQEGEFERLGSSRTIHVDARLIAATSRDLEAAVRAGKFREDLYYRLNVFPIHIPPLRERRDDIPILTWHFLRELGNRMGRQIESVRTGTMTSFQNYSWPGNVRELRNVIERHLITNPGPAFEAELPEAIHSDTTVGDTLEEVERRHILRVLDRMGWRVRGQQGAAQMLGLKSTTLESRMKKLGIARK